MSISSDKKLNSEQIEAIEHGGGPLLIIAGAGTGKTTVVTERIKHLIAQKNISPANILALTFTEKAALEMEERVDQALPLGYSNLWIYTFHGFCDRILRDEAINIGLDPKYKLMTEAENIQLLKKNLFKFDLDYFRPLGNPNKFIEGMLQHFSRLKDEDVQPNEYLKWVENKDLKLKTKNGEESLFEEIDKYRELAKAYQFYEEIKVKEGLMDFGDLMSNVLKIFRGRPNILKRYQDQFKYILVDEFQDTNYAQYVLVKFLAPPPVSNLTVVGDDNQCLPGETKISLLSGERRIDQIKPGDIVLTAVGKGHSSCSRVNKIFKNKKSARLLTFTLESGEKVTVTDNHKMFCYVPCREKRKDQHYVYLMKQKSLGWRLGVTNDLASRLKIESHADGILCVGSYETDQEARFYESFYSAKYGIPTVPFSPRERQAISGKWLEKIFSEINTERKASILASHLGLDLNSFSVNRNGVVRGVSERVKVNFQMCHRNYRNKTHKEGFLGNPLIQHLVYLETSSRDAIKVLENSGLILAKAKKGKRFRFVTQDISEAWKVADKIVNLTGGFLEKKFIVATDNFESKAAKIVPAGNVFPGNYLPVLKRKSIVYKKVIKREEEMKELEVYDLEIDKTHNFIANGVVVHNSIYKFRGAAISNILQLKDDYPKAKEVILNKNYRSTQSILDTSYKLIKHNDPDTLEAKLGISKKLQKMSSSEEVPVEFIFEDRVEDEAEAVAKEILKLRAENEKLSFKDFAILVRANSHAEPFIKALERAGITCQFLGPGMLFRQPEVKDLIAYLNVLSNFEDSVSMYRLLSMEYFGVEGRDLAGVLNICRKKKISLFETCEEVILDESVKISDQTRQTVSKLIKLIHGHMDLIKTETAGQLLYFFLEETGMLRKLTSYDNVDDEKKVQNIAKFFEKLKSYEVDHEDSSVYAVVDFINLSLELGESPLVKDTDWMQAEAVNLLTVHSAKGLEFPVVFLINLVNQRFPTLERKEQIPIPQELIKEILPTGDFHQEEERRLCYVGMTRAKNRLYLTAAKFYGEGRREKKVSPFVVEALGEAVLSQEPRQKAEQLTILGYEEKRKTQEKTKNSQNISIPVNLSYSQIDTFNLCPLKYKFSYVLGLPTPPSSALSFGNTIHETMRAFYQKAIAGQSPSKDDLLQIFEENWNSLGYTSKAHEERYKKEGIKLLDGYFGNAYNPKVLPFALEQSFAIKIGQSRINGKIDRIDLTKDGIEIIDYKTGKTSAQKEIDKDLQLSLYALTATEGTLTQMGILKKIPKPENVTVSFYFFDTQEKVSTVKKAEDLRKVREDLIQKIEQVRESPFSPTPGMHCDFCQYKVICDAWK